MPIHQALRSCGPLSSQTFFSCPSGDSSWRRGTPHADQGELVSGFGYFFSRNVAELNAKFKNPMIQDVSRPLRSLFEVWMGPRNCLLWRVRKTSVADSLPQSQSAASRGGYYLSIRFCQSVLCLVGAIPFSQVLFPVASLEAAAAAAASAKALLGNDYKDGSMEPVACQIVGSSSELLPDDLQMIFR